MAVVLMGIDGPAQGRSWELTPGALTLGSSEACDVCLADPAVGPIHAALQVADESVSIAARAGAAIAVDGRAAQGPVNLRPGSVIRVGRSLLRLETERAAADAGGGMALPPPDPPRWPMVLAIIATLMAVIAVALIVRFVPKRIVEVEDRMPAEAQASVKRGVAWIIANGGAVEGSGFVYRDGVVVTNAHVVEGASQIEVAFDAGTAQMRRVPARLSRAGAPGTPTDVAVLRCDTGGAPVLPVTVDRLAEGTGVVAFGYPLGSIVSTTSFGPAISVRGGRITAHRSAGAGELMWIETDIRAEVGNSGGPVVTLDGKVIGLATMIIGPNLKSTLVVPSATIRRFTGG